jgi:uncharacterized protein YigA (DUF484 family)
MSAGNRPERSTDSPQERDVVAYLQAHPDLLVRYPQLIASVSVPHTCGEAVSLVEYQVNVLRERNQELHARIDELVGNARDNEDLGRRLHRLTLELIGCHGAGDLFSTLQHSLSAQFATEYTALRLFAAPADPGDAALAEFDAAGARVREAFAAALEGDKPTCGRLRPEQVSLLFDEGSGAIGSGALIPLRGARAFGILALASGDPQRYHPGMGTVFLRQLGEVVSAVLRPHVTE